MQIQSKWGDQLICEVGLRSRVLSAGTPYHATWGEGMLALNLLYFHIPIYLYLPNWCFNLTNTDPFRSVLSGALMFLAALLLLP